VVKVEKTEPVTMNVMILLNQAFFEPLATQQNRLNYWFDKVHLRKLAADNLAAYASYEPPSHDEIEHKEVTHTGYVSTDPEFTESVSSCALMARPDRGALFSRT